jgi:hypothetical protein
MKGKYCRLSVQADVRGADVKRAAARGRSQKAARKAQGREPGQP